MTETTEEVIKDFIISDVELDDGVMGKLVSNKRGDPLFKLSSDFEDSQIDVVYNLCAHYFNIGAAEGRKIIQENLRKTLGITEDKPVGK